MENKIIGLFLNESLLELGDNDDRLRNLTDSVNDVAKHLKKEPGLIPHYTLVALDADIPADEPILLEVEKFVTKHWGTLRSRFHERPRVILRAVIAGALHQLGLEDPKVARLVYLSGSGYYPYSTPGREKEIIETLLGEMGDVAEEHAAEEWGFEEEVPELKTPTLKLGNLKFGEAKINEVPLNESLKKAAGRSPENYDPYNYPTQWAEHFAKNATEGISNALTGTLEIFSSSLKPTAIETPINTFFTDFKKSLSSVLKTAFQSMIAVERRSKLLWWKETLYSRHLKKGYREVEPVVLPVLMAYDLRNLLPLVTPLSVNYLLRDTFRLLGEDFQKPTTVEALLAELAAAPHRPLLKPLLESTNAEVGRLSLVEFIAQLLRNQVQTGEVFARTGIAPDRTLTPADLSVLVLNHLLTEKLLQE